MHRSISIAAFFLMSLSFVAVRSKLHAEQKVEQYSATAFVSDLYAPSSVQNTLAIDFYIYSYTPDDELQNLISISSSQGVSGLEKAFSKLKERGRMSVGVRPSQGALRFIRSSTSGNETVIRMATDRILSFQERTYHPAWSKYRFSVIELHVDAQGKGQGTLSYAAKLKFNNQGELDVENYTAAPISLGNVRKLK